MLVAAGLKKMLLWTDLDARRPGRHGGGEGNGGREIAVLAGMVLGDPDAAEAQVLLTEVNRVTATATITPSATPSS